MSMAPGPTPFPGANKGQPPIVPITPGSAAPASAPDHVNLAEVSLDLEKTKQLIQKYRSTFHENPIGNNAEIMKQLMGGNPKEVKIEPEGGDGQRLNGNGELVDRWGTPYFFHSISAQEMEIRSAGPDKKMWTNDDLITR
jgi:hypothetical protein